MFQAASMSKSIFAVTVMKLYELGLVDIYQDVSKHLDLNRLDLFQDEFVTISLYDLLTHTAGLNIHGFSGYLYGQKLPSLEEMILGIRPSNSLKLKMIKKPKTEFMYSGGGYILAQYIIEKIMNETYENLVERLVFKPLMMHHSTVSIPLKDEFKQKIAIGYSSYDTKLDHGYLNYPELSAAGLWTTPSDLALFGIEMMKVLHKKSDFLKQSSLELMLKIPNGIKSEYGMGFQIKQTQKGLIFGHGGDNTGYHGYMAFNHQLKNGLVVMINSDIGEDLPKEIIKAFITL
jgi:CubicO group peptidase (beta-lactamase class C family)